MNTRTVLPLQAEQIPIQRAERSSINLHIGISYNGEVNLDFGKVNKVIDASKQ